MSLVIVSGLFHRVQPLSPLAPRLCLCFTCDIRVQLVLICQYVSCSKIVIESPPPESPAFPQNFKKCSRVPPEIGCASFRRNKYKNLYTSQAKAIYRFPMGVRAKFIAAAGKKLVNKLQSRAGRERAQQPGDQKHAWAKNLLTNVQTIPSPAPRPPWSKAPTRYLDKLSATNAARNNHIRSMEKFHLNTWTQS